MHDGGRTRYKLEPEQEGCAAVRVVRRMFDMALEGSGVKEIAMALNREGLRTHGGERWGKVTVHKVLTNEAYCGTLVWGGRPGHPAVHGGDTPVRVKNAWPAIIDGHTFSLVQEKMAARSPRIVHPRTVPSQYLLSGLLFCCCGRAMTGHSAKSGRHFYYSCSRALKQGRDACEAVSLPKEKLERAVVAQLKARVLTNENLEKLVMLVNEELQSASAGLKDRLDCLDAEMADVKGRLSRLYEAPETGKLDLADLSPGIKELRARHDEPSGARVQTDAEMVANGVQQVDSARVRAYAQDLRALLEEADIVERKSFLRSFVRRIDVNQGHVIVHYTLPMPPDGNASNEVGVLSTVTPGGEGGTRTPTPCGTWS